MKDWWIFRGTREPHDLIEKKLPPPPSWRRFSGDDENRNKLPPDLCVEHCDIGDTVRGATYYLCNEEEEDVRQIELVNAALYLRRPLLITGGPGTGKTSLAYAVAYELNLGPVLVWPITTRSTLEEGLYQYDAVARLQAITIEKERQSLSKERQGSSPEAQNESNDIGRYLRLGPLGTALRTSRPKRPRVLLIDEIDKSDIDLPNNLLHVFEEGRFRISELKRLPERKEYHRVKIRPYDDRGPALEIELGDVRCYEFPLVIMTSNGERDFPPPFLRRCLSLKLAPPSPRKLAEIVKQHLGLEHKDQPNDLVGEFLNRQSNLATDQLLNAIFLTVQGVDLSKAEELRDNLLKNLSSS